VPETPSVLTRIFLFNIVHQCIIEVSFLTVSLYSDLGHERKARIDGKSELGSLIHQNYRTSLLVVLTRRSLLLPRPSSRTNRHV